MPGYESSMQLIFQSFFMLYLILELNLLVTRVSSTAKRFRTDGAPSVTSLRKRTASGDYPGITGLQATRRPALRAGHPGPLETSRPPAITASVLNAPSRTPTAIRPLSRHDQQASARRLYLRTSQTRKRPRRWS